MAPMERMARTEHLVSMAETEPMGKTVMMDKMETTALHHSLLPALNQLESIALTAVRLLKRALTTTVIIRFLPMKLIHCSLFATVIAVRTEQMELTAITELTALMELMELTG